MSNPFRFLKVYADIRNNQVNKSELTELYLFLKGRSTGTSLGHYFEKSAITSSQIKQTIF